MGSARAIRRLELEHPVIGAGLGGGLSRARLTAAIGEAGGLGQIGILPADRLRAEIAAHRERTRALVAVNLLLPFARRDHWDAAREADAVVTFWGRPRRATEGIWVHQCGSVAEARAAVRAGVDGVIAQGFEAGGHVRGREPALRLVAEVRAALPAGFPVWMAGGIARRPDVEAALAAGADAVVVGTRFLLSEESDAHEEYKRRLTAATSTVLTDLFGLGWPAPHRVVRNAATDRWLDGDDRAPRWLSWLHRLTAPAVARAPLAWAERAARAQRPDLPLLGPSAPTAGAAPGLVDASPLYAGACVSRIEDVRPAGDLVRDLAGATP